MHFYSLSPHSVVCSVVWFILIWLLLPHCKVFLFIVIKGFIMLICKFKLKFHHVLVFPLFFLCIFLCSSALFSTLFSVCIFYKHRTLSLSHNDRLFQWENSVQYYDRYTSYDRFALQLLAVYSLFMLLSSSESSHCFPWGWILLCVLLNGSLSQLS